MAACFTIIKGIHQLAGVDLCSPDQDVVQSPLCPVGAGHHDPVAESERLPPAQAGGVGQGVLGEKDVVVPHWDVLLVIHIMEQSPGYPWNEKMQV